MGLRSARLVAILLMPMNAGDVFMYRDSSIALWLDLRRRLKAVMDVLDSMILNSVSLARSVELSVQWDRILRAGPVHPITLDDFHAAGAAVLVTFFELRAIVVVVFWIGS